MAATVANGPFAVCGYDVLNAKVGQGTYGSIWQVRREQQPLSPPSPVEAMKVTKKTIEADPTLHGERVVEALNEAHVLSSLRHPNLLHSRHIFQHCDDIKQESERRDHRGAASEMYLVVPYATTDLSRWIEWAWPNLENPSSTTVPRKGSRPQAIRFAYQLLCGLQHLHQQELIHLDLKPANVLVFLDAPSPDEGGERKASGASSLSLKLADFGFTTGVHGVQRPTGEAMTSPMYRAPEVQCGSIVYTAAADMWAAGLIFAELLLGLSFEILTHRAFRDRGGGEGKDPLSADLFPWMVALRGRPSARFHEQWTSRFPTPQYPSPPPTSREADTSHQLTDEWCPRGADDDTAESKQARPPISIVSFMLPSVISHLQKEYGSEDFWFIVKLVDGLLAISPDDRWTAEEALQSGLFDKSEKALGSCILHDRPQLSVLDGAAYARAYRDNLKIVGYKEYHRDGMYKGPSRPFWQSQLVDGEFVSRVVGFTVDDRTLAYAGQILAHVAAARRQSQAPAIVPPGRRRGQKERQQTEEKTTESEKSKRLDELAALMLASLLNWDRLLWSAESLAMVLEAHWPDPSTPIPSRGSLANAIVERSRQIEHLLRWKFLVPVEAYH